MAVYMNWDGIDGAVTTKGFEKWIELSSFQWGVGRAIGTAARGAATREATEPNISEIVVSKRLDKASRVARKVGQQAVVRVKTAAKHALGAAGLIRHS